MLASTQTASRARAEERRFSIERSGPVLAIALRGAWSIRDRLADLAPVTEALGSRGISSVTVRMDAVERWDSALPVFLDALAGLCERAGAQLDLSELPQGLRALVHLAHTSPRTRPPPAAEPKSMAVRVGDAAFDALARGDAQVRFIGDLARASTRLFLGRATMRRADLLETVQDSGPRSLPIVTTISALVGMILAFVGAAQLRRFGAGIYVADLVAIAIVRELAAVMTGIVLAGRVGAAFAARLGAMRGQDEIDALEVLGLRPMDFLVLPRVLGLTLMMPFLYLYAAFVGVLGGLAVSSLMLDISSTLYLQESRNALSLSQFGIGLAKSVVFGVLIAAAGCLRGLQAGRSAAAVGDAVTSAVVTGILYVIIADAVFAVVLEVLGL